MGRRDRRRNLAAAMGLVVLIGAGVGLTAIGPEALIPVPGLTVRLDLIATRDLEVNGDLPAGGTSDNKPLVSDQTWTRTGGESCYAISTTDASCFASSEVPYTWDATRFGWVVEPDATNRVLYSALAGGIDCTNWTCAGTASATPLQNAPNGSATASIVAPATGTNTIYWGGSVYTADAPLYPRFWIKCSTGSLNVKNTYGDALGLWTVDCSVVAGQWTFVGTTAHAAVTKTNSWAVNATGGAGFVFQAVLGTVTASIWAPTLTEEPGTGLAVIPTGASAVSTGDPVWAIANGLRNTGSQLLVDGDQEAATTAAYTAGNNAALTKETTTPHGGARLLRVAYNGTIQPYAYQSITTIGEMHRVIGWAHGDGTVAPRVIDGTVILWTGTSSGSWQLFDVTYLASSTQMRLYAATGVAGYAEFDDVTVYEQESYGDYYRTGDTVTLDITEFSGTCWDPLTSTGDLLLSGLEGTQCAGLIHSIEVTR